MTDGRLPMRNLDLELFLQRSGLAEFVGGPLDGLVTTEWEPVPEALKAGFAMTRMPPPYPMGDAVAIVYLCTGFEPEDDRVRLTYVALEGPDGDPLDVRGSGGERSR